MGPASDRRPGVCRKKTGKAVGVLHKVGTLTGCKIVHPCGFGLFVEMKGCRVLDGLWVDCVSR